MSWSTTAPIIGGFFLGWAFGTMYEEPPLLTGMLVIFGVLGLLFGLV